jgi:hypothetical protein
MDDAALDRVRTSLAALAEELADMGRARLGEAVGAGPGDVSAAAVADERRLVRARRAVLKAVAVLGGSEESEGDT